MNLFYSNFNKSDSDIILDEIDSKHLSKSLRKKVGDIIRVTKNIKLDYLKEKNIGTVCKNEKELKKALQVFIK